MLRISRSSVGDGNVGFTQTTCSPLWWWCDRCDRSIRSYEFYDTKLLVPTAATFQYPCFPCFTLMHTPQLQAMTYMLLMQIPNICLHIRTQCGSGGRPVGRLADGSIRVWVCVTGWICPVVGSALWVFNVHLSGSLVVIPGSFISSCLCKARCRPKSRSLRPF